MASLIFTDAAPEDPSAELVFPDELPVGTLIFTEPVDDTLPVELVFTEDGPAPPEGRDATIELVAAVTALTASIPIIEPVYIGLVANVTGSLGGAVEIDYDSDTPRPEVADIRSAWQDGTDLHDETSAVWQDTAKSPLTAVNGWQQAKPLSAESSPGWQQATPTRRETDNRFQEAMRLATRALGSSFQEAVRVRSEPTSVFERARPLHFSRSAKYEDADRTKRRFVESHYQEGVVLVVQVANSLRDGLDLRIRVESFYQEARRPPAGKHVRPIPVDDPCYVPSLPVELIFEEEPLTSAILAFVCERHLTPAPEPAVVVVPVRRVYMQLNDATLTRVDGSVLIPTYNMSISLDVDSWTWSFNASVPGQALSDLEPAGSGEPVEVDAEINGAHFRFIVESISRERTFGKDSLRVGGRGKSALLDSPYAPEMSFFNEELRTANQLMEDVLTLNGVPLPWTVEWQIDDWVVPAGAFSSMGSYMAALTQIAAAPGAYIQPHPTAQTLYVKPRFPAMPFQWSTLTPDIELPSAGVTRESIEWRNLPEYNRVFVSGTSQGVLGQVTLAGTDGSAVAPMVTDALITSAVAARQRGLSVLSQTGRQAPVSLRMPIFPETGIITPGKLVRYVDGATERLGLSRSVSVDVGLPAIWQTVTLETYE